MFRALFALSAALGLLLLACGGGTDSDETPVATVVATAPAEVRCAPARPATAGTTPREVTSGGVQRGYLLHVPSGYDGESRRAVVIAFHGLASSNELQARVDALAELAEAQGFIVIWPAALNEPPRWNNANNPSDTSDVAFVGDLLDAVEAELCVEPGAVFVTGYSNGAGMAQRVACEMPDRIAAVALVAGQYVSCVAPMPLLAFHGTEDSVLPFDGGSSLAFPDSTFLPARRVISEWARALGCDPLPTISRLGDEVELSSFGNCPLGENEAALYAIIGGGHTWPGSELELPVDVVGVTTDAIDATETIWEFFASTGAPSIEPAGGGSGDGDGPAADQD